MNVPPGARRARLCLFVAGCWASAAIGVAHAQWPTDPIALADGRVTIGGDVSAGFGSADPGFFNYTDYEHSELRMLRVNVSAAVKANDHVAILGDVLTENLNHIRPYALYLRVRPWTRRAIDIQAGRVPPTFGGFSRRTYVHDNPLIGYPLAYQYLTSLRPDSLPATVDELLQKRSFGWRLRYSIGSDAQEPGVPVVSAFRWDTGVQVHAVSRFLTGTVSVTSGTISNPRFKDDNDGRQVAARGEARPIVGLVLGAPVARGAFVDNAALRSAGTAAMAGTFEQNAWGADLEYSRDHYLVRAETIVSAWQIPFAAQPAATASDPLRAYSTSVEGRYKIKPGVYAAARVDRLGFSTVTGTLSSAPWDAPVQRVEVGAGFSIQRNLLLKLAYQRNTRDGGRLATKANLGAMQLVFWF
jgi:hypothetical protein